MVEHNKQSKGSGCSRPNCEVVGPFNHLLGKLEVQEKQNEKLADALTDLDKSVRNMEDRFSRSADNNGIAIEQLTKTVDMMSQTMQVNIARTDKIEATVETIMRNHSSQLEELSTLLFQQIQHQENVITAINSAAMTISESKDDDDTTLSATERLVLHWGLHGSKWLIGIIVAVVISAVINGHVRKQFSADATVPPKVAITEPRPQTREQ